MCEKCAVVVLHTVTQDSFPRLAAPRCQTLHWSDERCRVHATSIADIAEDKLIERLFADPLWSTEFFELAGMPRGMLNKQRVPLDTALGNFKGDIDVLHCAPDHPEQAVACQLKRIKFGMDQLRNGTPTKLREFSKVAQQANPVARMGFWQIYAYVVVAVDGREQNAGRNTYEGLSS